MPMRTPNGLVGEYIQADAGEKADYDPGSSGYSWRWSIGFSGSRMAYLSPSCSRYWYTSGQAKAPSTRKYLRRPLSRYRLTMGTNTPRQFSALGTCPGRSKAPSQSPRWLK